MTNRTPYRPRNGSTATRLTVLEEHLHSLLQEVTANGTRLDRVYEFVFGSDRNEDSMKAQVKALGKQIETLTSALQISTQESVEFRKHITDRMEAVENRQRLMEDWKAAQITAQQDKSGERKQYRFMLASAVTSSSVSILIGWLLGRMLPH